MVRGAGAVKGVREGRRKHVGVVFVGVALAEELVVGGVGGGAEREAGLVVEGDVEAGGGRVEREVGEGVAQEHGALGVDGGEVEAGVGVEGERGEGVALQAEAVQERDEVELHVCRAGQGDAREAVGAEVEEGEVVAVHGDL